jgi:hypothetical protein
LESETQGEVMNVFEQKKLLVERILPYLTGAPDDVVQRLLQKTVSDLETILEDAITTKARAEAAERITQHAEEMRRESQLEGAFVHTCMAIINNRRLSTCDSNRAMLESLLNPGETPSSKLYVALVEQFPDRFTWESLKAQPTKEEQRAEFDAFVSKNNFSGCEANFELFKRGASIENFAHASQAEETAYAEQAALQRNKWLRTEASPLELKAEARYETQTKVGASQQVQADASLQVQKQRDQYAGYKPLPTHIDREALIRASKDELRKWSRLYGQFQLNTALRAQQ